MPVELDELERRRIQLEIEREALRKEKDDASRARLEALERELADISERAGALKSQWEQEKGAIAALRADQVGAGEAPATRSRRPSGPPTTAGPPSCKYGRQVGAAGSGSGSRRPPSPSRTAAAAGCSRRRSTRTTSPASWPPGRASR